ncbi:MAG: lysis system i-spanin subunit Rz [Rickettsiales bacterium]
MNPLYKWAGAGALLLFAVVAVFQAGHHAGKNKERAKWLVEQQKWYDEANELKAQADRQRREHEQIVDTLEENHLKEVRQIENTKDSIIGELRSGNLKLRERFQRAPSCPSGGTSTKASSASHGVSGGGLFEADAEFLVRFAAQCDSVANQLISAQNYIRSLEILR